ncbi:unnamed protein product [Sphagnum compactum]
MALRRCCSSQRYNDGVTALQLASWERCSSQRYDAVALQLASRQRCCYATMAGGMEQRKLLLVATQAPFGSSNTSSSNTRSKNSKIQRQKKFATFNIKQQIVEFF